jgi:alpha-tubulin suppressor-like RCC1 family protein
VTSQFLCVAGDDCDGYNDRMCVCGICSVDEGSMCVVRGPSVGEGVKYGGGLYPTKLAANATTTVLCELDVSSGPAEDDGPALRGRQLYFEDTVHLLRTTANGACAVNGDTLYCWGALVGQESSTAFETPQALLTPDVRKPAGRAALGGHACVIMDRKRGLRCWGDNSNGQLGDGTTVSTSSPPSKSVLTGVHGVGVGKGFTCVVRNKRRGPVYCWGLNDKGQLGNGHTTDVYNPPKSFSKATPVITKSDFLSCASDMCCALDRSVGRVKCWGSNAYGRLGLDEHTEYSADAVEIVGLYDKNGNEGKIEVVVVGEKNVCANVAGGYMYCWGDNSNGQLGSGSWDVHQSSHPVQVSLPSKVYPDEIAISSNNVCVTSTKGNIYCWGAKNVMNGLVGSTEDVYTPVQLPRRFDARDIFAGDNHFCALDEVYHVICWGRNNKKQLGGSVYPVSSWSPLVWVDFP